MPKKRGRMNAEDRQFAKLLPAAALALTGMIVVALLAGNTDTVLWEMLVGAAGGVLACVPLVMFALWWTERKAQADAPDMPTPPEGWEYQTTTWQETDDSGLVVTCAELMLVPKPKGDA